MAITSGVLNFVDTCVDFCIVSGFRTIYLADGSNIVLCLTVILTGGSNLQYLMPKAKKVVGSKEERSFEATLDEQNVRASKGSGLYAIVLTVF